MGSKYEFPFAVRHGGELGCNKDALYLNKRFNAGDILYAKNVQYLDGTRPNDNEVAICGSCGARININNELMADDIYERGN